MSDFVWYSRLAVWAGAAVLLVQAVTGRSAGVVTVLAVVILSAGFVAFLVGLMWAERSERALALAAGGQERANLAVETAPERTPLRLEEVPAPVTREEPRPAPIPRGTVRATEVAAGGAEVGEICPGCGRSVVEGEVVVRCFSCGELQHAACWTENHFRCAAPGCLARGGVDAPD